MQRRSLSYDPRFETPANTRILTMADLGELIRLRRRELGMTQADVSRCTGFSTRLIGEIEHGKEHVAADKLLTILDVLNMTMVIHTEGK